MNAQQSISEAISKALAGLGIEGVSPTLERPADMSHGDWATNVALAAAKQAGKNPRELADEIVAKLLENKPEHVVSIDVAGPGFINFKLADTYFVEQLVTITPETAGRGNSHAGKTVLVEYTQPNILKPFHIGHLMSNAIGESLSRLIENAGATVKRLNYQGDVGLHVAKALWGIKNLNADVHDIDAIGKAYAHGAQAYENDEKAKEEIVAINKQVYEKDPEVMQLYEAGKKTSLARFEELYELLGTRFDRYYLESEVFERGVEIVREGQERGVFKESDGAVVFPGEDYGLHTRVFITSKGLPVYEAKELALAELKAHEYPDFDTSITTTAVEQQHYFQVVLKAFGLLYPKLDGKFRNVSHGMMQLANGKMSSRLGNVITGESIVLSLVDEVKERMGERVAPDAVDATARAVGVAAIKYSVLRQAVNKNISFDEEKSLSFEGDSGPYIQYACVRARSIVTKAHEAGIEPSLATAPDTVGGVERLLERFPEVAERAARELEPHHVATYAIELASAFNSWYASEQIINPDDALSPYRVALAQKVGVVLERALWLLGIRVPEAM